MSKHARVEMTVFLGLLGAGIVSRILLSDLPNVAPVAAIALFAGYFFRSRRIAFAIPLSVMLLSDLFLESYTAALTLIVYGALAAPVLLSHYLRRWPSITERPVLASVGLLTCSLGGSLFFFAVTNFATWMFFNTYEHSLAGLTVCYAQAIPFFRYTLLGDFVFNIVLFGGYAIALYAIRSPHCDTVSAECT